MQLELTEDQEFFRATTRKFIESEIPLTAVRSLYESPVGFDRGWWRRATALGWTSPFVPEEFGGGSLSGRPTSDAVIVAEEMGSLVTPGPFLPVNVVAAALGWDGNDAHGPVLEALVSGETIASWAVAEPGDRWSSDRWTTTATIGDDEVVVDGEKAYVEAAGVAEHFLVSARMGDGLGQVLVPAGADGVSIVRGRSVDMTRRFGTIRLDRVRLPSRALVGDPGAAGPTIRRQYRLALALQCAEMVGLTQRTFDTTIEYGVDRIAFGRPIVSFQSLKHRLADMAVSLEGMKAIGEALVGVVDNDDSDAEGDRISSAAKAYIGQHAVQIIDDCVQIVGGMGVTWEHDIHLYNRRAVVDRAMYGTPEWHRRNIIRISREAARP